MKAKIINLHLENFGIHSEVVGNKNLDFDLGGRTIISGCNRVGKSTIRRSIQWLLNCKGEDGKEISGVRPHNAEGIDIDGLTTIAEMTVSIDGAENTMKKTYFQKKSRQGEYTGENDTQYFIDGVRKNTKKAYDEFVQTILPDPVCMSAQEFFKQDTTGRRNLLESTFFSRTTDEIIDQNPEFEELRGKLRANSVSDLKSACNEKINGKGRGANHVDGLNDKLTKLNHQIEFELSKKVDIDVAELELKKNALNEQIAKNKAKQEDISKEFEEQQKASDGVIELQFELNDLQRKANEELIKQKRDLQSQIDESKQNIREIETEIKDSERTMSGYEQDIESGEKERKRLLEQWEAVNAENFDENTAICPTCHRELPSDEREGLLSAFEKSKIDRIANIEKYGLEVKADIDNANLMIPKLKDYIKERKERKEKLEKEVSDLEKKLSELPESIDISDRPEVQEIQRKIAEKEAAMNKGNSAEDMRQQLRCLGDDLREQLIEVQKQLDKVEENNRIDKTVGELKVKQRSVSQEIANVEMELDLLKQFDRKKAELLESDVNSNFEYIKVKMTEPQVNGDLKDVCQIMVDGESYDRNLNHGARILAEIDICRAFQKANNVCLPIIVDDCESLDDWRVPNIENQLIIIKRSDDKELKIEVEG